MSDGDNGLEERVDALEFLLRETRDTLGEISRAHRTMLSRHDAELCTLTAEVKDITARLDSHSAVLCGLHGGKK